MTSETVDPIALLREFVKQQWTIKADSKKRLDFTEKRLKLPFDTMTAWKKCGGPDHYNLGSLWLAITEKDSKISDYSRRATELQIS